MVNSKHAFWMALVFTAAVFIIGIIFGFFLEYNRSNELAINSLRSEINLLDEQVRSKVITNNNISCDIAKESIFAFADKIYIEAFKLEKYDASNKFIDDLKEIHKRYDLLRMILWDEATIIKNNCDSNFHTIVYFFDYNVEDINIKSQQTAISRLITDMKNKNPDEILVIPIAANLDLESVKLTLRNYNITEKPAILIDEGESINHVPSFTEFENAIFQT